ncbi:hypothetical protein POSPLADRAFT_1102030, partial [Postia placenta MAD-698-R-SB12]
MSPATTPKATGIELPSSSVTDNRALIILRSPLPPTKGATYRSDESSTPAAPHSGTRIPQPVASTGQARGDPHLPRGTEAVAQPSATPQAIPQSSLGPRLERSPKTEPRNTPPHSWAGSSSAVTALTSVPILRHPTSGLPQLISPPSPPRGRSSTRSSRSSPGGQSQQSPSPAGSPSSPSPPVMSSPAAVPDKEMLKLLLPLRYDGKSVVECNHFISQLLIYWTINTAVTSWSYAHLPVLPPSTVAACQGQIHAFDSQDLIDVYIPDGLETILHRCEQQPCPNRTPRSIEEDYPRYKAIRRAQHPLGPQSTLASRSALWHSRPVSPTSRLPQTVADQARGDLPPDP